MHAAVDRLYAEKDDVTGVVDHLARRRPSSPAATSRACSPRRPTTPRPSSRWARRIKADLRRLETFGKPVVAAINGAALGGGLEITLACHHRIVVDDAKVELGLPEATLGLLPGGGGVTRTVRMFGIQSALMDVLLQGPRFKPAAAKEKGLVDELVAEPRRPRPRREEVDRVGHRTTRPAASNPWDREGYKMPGGTPVQPRRWPAFLPAFPAMLRKQTKGAVYPAPRAIMAAAIEGAQVDFDTASRIESRYLAELITGSNSKNMIQAFFFDLSAINSGAAAPQGRPEVHGHQGRRARRRDDGRRHRLLVRSRRHGGRAQGRRAGVRRQGQGLQREAPGQGRRARQDGRGEEGRDPRPDHRDHRGRPTSRAATWSSRPSSRTRRSRPRSSARSRTS